MVHWTVGDLKMTDFNRLEAGDSELDEIFLRYKPDDQPANMDSS